MTTWWDALVRFSEWPGGWVVPLAVLVIGLLTVFAAVWKALDRLEDWRALPPANVVNLAARRRELLAAVQMGRRR